LAAFAERGRSALYRTATDNRPLGTLEAFVAFSASAPVARRIWLERLMAVNRDAVWSIVDRVPIERMSETCKRFTLELLSTNRQRLLQIEQP
jgi:hypothetical protein